MRRLRAGSEAEMIALFLSTELPAARFRDTLRALLDQAGLPESLITDPDLNDPAENQAREQLLTAHRGYGTRTGLFEGLPHDVRWEWMAITPAELATVRYIDYDYWVELSGGTRLAADAAPRIRAGVAPFGVSSDWALGMAQAVAGGARFPPLILVTTGPSGDLVVLEGHARLTAYMLCPDRLPPELDVLVGSSPDMPEKLAGPRSGPARGHPALGQDALDDGLLQPVGRGDVGLARGEHVRVEERLPQPDERVRERARLDDRDQPELGHVAAQQLLVEGDDPALHPAARVGEHAHGQGGLVVQQPAQSLRSGDHRVDVPDGAGGVQLAFGPFGLPARDGDVQHALGEPPQGPAEQFLPAADAPEQRHP
jgi:hypothetical protein